MAGAMAGERRSAGEQRGQERGQGHTQPPRPHPRDRLPPATPPPPYSCQQPPTINPPRGLIHHVASPGAHCLTSGYSQGDQHRSFGTDAPGGVATRVLHPPEGQTPFLGSTLEWKYSQTHFPSFSATFIAGPRSRECLLLPGSTNPALLDQAGHSKVRPARGRPQTPRVVGTLPCKRAQGSTRSCHSEESSDLGDRDLAVWWLPSQGPAHGKTSQVFTGFYAVGGRERPDPDRGRILGIQFQVFQTKTRQVHQDLLSPRT